MSGEDPHVGIRAQLTGQRGAPPARERLHIYRCPECGTISGGWKSGPRFCSGDQWLMESPLGVEQGDHPSVEMERLTVEVVEKS